MLHFEKNKMIITVECAGDPVEQWVKTHEEMVDLLSSEAEDLQTKRINYLELLKNMIPEYTAVSVR